MKKLLLLVCSISILSGVIAQKRAMIPEDLRNISIQRNAAITHQPDQVLQKPANPFAENAVKFTEEEYQIGTTWYDLQSNGPLGNRMWLYDDGTIGATWTMGFTATAFPDRGTGYNYFVGTSWGTQPTTRIESIRSGWPSYAPFGENGEIVVSHEFTNGKLFIETRTDKGTGLWNESFFEGPTGQKISWPRMTTSGSTNEIIHLLASTWPVGNGGTLYLGQDGATLYSRSTDGGTTWDIDNAVLEGMGIDSYSSIAADEYVWAEPRGNTIAFVVCDSWHDLFIMKSEDNGSNWEKTMIWEHPYPFFDWDVTLTTDTLWAPDNSASIAIDNSGRVHVVFGLSRVAHFEVGTTYSYWPFSDGIAYWNEDMPAFEDPNGNPHDALDAWDVLIEDYNLIGWTQDVNNNGVIDILEDIIAYRELGISTMPNISIRESDNQIFVAFASTTETFDNTVNNFKHIWIRRSPDGGTTWNPSFYDLTDDLVHIFDECVYPVLAGSVDGKVHLIYNADATPGVALDDQHTYQENKIYYHSIDVSDFTGENENIAVKPIIQVGQNYPNPFNGSCIIPVKLRQETNFSLIIRNLQGQELITKTYTKVPGGNHQLIVDASHFAPGVYYYSIETPDQTFSGKMMIR